MSSCRVRSPVEETRPRRVFSSFRYRANRFGPKHAFTVIGIGYALKGPTSRSRKMKESTKDQVKGAVHEAKGKVKETVGRATDNPNLEAEGQDENVSGKIQKKVGQVEKVFEK